MPPEEQEYIVEKMDLVKTNQRAPLRVQPYEWIAPSGN
jgi:hypothetical protein